ncbi:MAG: hypothetical protein IJA34_00360 [Lachnospiraceae bacterium]|nr:hypothetical protein [Lachnospiraceae bacterium]
MFDFPTPYTDMFNQDMKRMVKKLKNKPVVLHQKTCPYCDRKLVNLYYSSTLEKYICKKCLDKHIGEKE